MEALSAAIRLLGWHRGPLSFEVVAENGRVKKIYPRPAAMGRNELDELCTDTAPAALTTAGGS